jgi:hypothetical protein
VFHRWIVPTQIREDCCQISLDGTLDAEVVNLPGEHQGFLEAF